MQKRTADRCFSRGTATKIGLQFGSVSCLTGKQNLEILAMGESRESAVAFLSWSIFWGFGMVLR
jgi:hypothetical protein